jgi:hypothetical protein
MGNKGFLMVVLFSVLLSAPVLSSAQVLGPCGAPPGSEEAQAVSAAPPPELAVTPLPLPGQRALDFELTAVVGDVIKNIKLSDYNGKWRVLCFFPAAFTFV